MSCSFCSCELMLLDFINPIESLSFVMWLMYMYRHTSNDLFSLLIELQNIYNCTYLLTNTLCCLHSSNHSSQSRHCWKRWWPNVSIKIPVKFESHCIQRLYQAEHCSAGSLRYRIDPANLDSSSSHSTRCCQFINTNVMIFPRRTVIQHYSIFPF